MEEDEGQLGPSSFPTLFSQRLLLAACSIPTGRLLNGIYLVLVRTVFRELSDQSLPFPRPDPFPSPQPRLNQLELRSLGHSLNFKARRRPIPHPSRPPPNHLPLRPTPRLQSTLQDPPPFPQPRTDRVRRSRLSLQRIKRLLPQRLRSSLLVEQDQRNRPQRSHPFRFFPGRTRPPRWSPPSLRLSLASSHDPAPRSYPPFSTLPHHHLLGSTDIAIRQEDMDQ